MSSAAASNPPPHVIEDCRGVLRVFSDGSIVRSPDSSFPIAVRDDGTVDWKDTLFDPTHNLHLRLYKPRHRRPSGGPKLPILYYFHGGGFCIGSRTWPNFHACCLRLAAEIPAIVVSPDYRLAPEHRLPAAIEDGASAVEWLRSQADSPDAWLAEDADLGRVFILGESAGGNIAHHLAVRFGGRTEPGPVRVRGYVLLMPAFGGTQRTRSEAESPAEAFLTLELNDRYWRLALPPGATADHPLVNPFGPGGPSLDRAELGPMLVAVGGRDLLRDREVEYARRLEGWGKAVELVEFPGKQHGFFCTDPWSEPSDQLLQVIKRFMCTT